MGGVLRRAEERGLVAVGEDFIILCVCLEVFHAFRFLTNLCPKGMTLGINEALAVSSSTAEVM